MATEDEIREQRERLSKMSSDAVRGEIPTWKPHAAARIAGEIILEERAKAEAAKPQQKWQTTWWGGLILAVCGGLIVTFLAWRVKKGSCLTIYLLALPREPGCAWCGRMAGPRYGVGLRRLWCGRFAVY